MTNTIGRNDPCPCGSGKKYKKCCGQSGMGKHTATVISGGKTPSSLLGRISEAGASVQAAKKEDTAFHKSIKKIEPKTKS